MGRVLFALIPQPLSHSVEEGVSGYGGDGRVQWEGTRLFFLPSPAGANEGEQLALRTRLAPLSHAVGEGLGVRANQGALRLLGLHLTHLNPRWG